MSSQRVSIVVPIGHPGRCRPCGVLGAAGNVMAQALKDVQTLTRRWC